MKCIEKKFDPKNRPVELFEKTSTKQVTKTVKEKIMVKEVVDGEEKEVEKEVEKTVQEPKTTTNYYVHKKATAFKTKAIKDKNQADKIFNHLIACSQNQ